MDRLGNTIDIFNGNDPGNLSYVDPRLINGRALGILYENELQTMSANDRCSFAICKADPRSNKLEVDWFRSKYGESGHRYECLYNPKNYTQVIASRKYKSIHIFHAVFWPITLVIICSVSWYVLKKCKDDLDEMNGNQEKIRIDKLNHIPQAGKINKFGQMDYNREGWPVWPSLVEGYNSQLLELNKPGDPNLKKKNPKSTANIVKRKQQQQLQQQQQKLHQQQQQQHNNLGTNHPRTESLNNLVRVTNNQHQQLNRMGQSLNPNDLIQQQVNLSRNLSQNTAYLQEMVQRQMERILEIIFSCC